MARILPYISGENCFALKGGTAINLFVRELPRMSVDIDLVYVPLEDRKTSLQGISTALGRIAAHIRKTIPGISVMPSTFSGLEASPKLFIRKDGLLVKVEPNTILRGLLFPARAMSFSASAEKLFNMSASVPVVSLADLYGGKLCAALDRQHPRDLFDIKLLLDNEGITGDIRKAFVIYLAGHDRTMCDLLDPALKDIKPDYEGEFQGMTITDVPLSALRNVQKKLAPMILQAMTDNEKQFLISFKQGEPQWELMGIPNLETLPALRWKQLNIKKMDKARHKAQLDKLKKVLVA